MTGFSNSVTSARWADGFENYFQFLLLQFFVPLIIGFIIIFILSAIYIKYKKFKDLKKIKYGFIYLAAILVFFEISMSPIIIYSLPSYSSDFKFHANSAWDYKATMVTNLTDFNNVLDEFIDGIFCEDQCALNNTIGKDVTKPLQKVIHTVDSYFSNKTISDAKNIFKKTEMAILAIQIVTLIFVVFGIIYVLSSFLINQALKEKYAKRIYIFSIVISSVALFISIAFLLGSVLVSDACNDYTNIATNYIDQEDLNFYLTCDPNSNNATDEFPPFLFTDDILNIVRHDDDLVNVTDVICYIENRTTIGGKNDLDAVKVFKKLELIFNKSMPAFNKTRCKSCACSPALARQVLDLIGNYSEHTGLYGLLECKPAHTRLLKIESSVCSIFSPMIAFFVLFLNLSGHMLFAFYFRV